MWKCHPDRLGSLGWASSCKAKDPGHRFDSWSGHQPGLRTRSSAGQVREAMDRRFSPFLSPSFPLSVNINEIFLKERCESALKKEKSLYKQKLLCNHNCSKQHSGNCPHRSWPFPPLEYRSTKAAHLFKQQSFLDCGLDFLLCPFLCSLLEITS